jgi:hypothetical protein
MVRVVPSAAQYSNRGPGMCIHFGESKTTALAAELCSCGVQSINNLW